jgi:hypothetical protein
MGWLRRITLRVLKARHSSLAVIVAAALGLIAGSVPILDAWEKLQVAVGVKLDALGVAQDTAKGALSRQLMQDAWARLNAIRRYHSSVKYAYPADAQSALWAKYGDAVDRWNADLMVNILMLRDFYSDQKAHQLEGDVQSRFGATHQCMVRLRYRAELTNKPEIECAQDQSGDLDKLDSQVNELNVTLYCFASGLTPKGDLCAGQHRGWFVFGTS